MKPKLANYLNAETEKLKAKQRHERRNIIRLPEGHKWIANNHAPASESWFNCQCGAFFIHDMIDGSCKFEDGDGTCDKE